MNMSVDGAFIYFTIPILGGINITQTAVSHLIVTIFLCSLSIYLGKRLTKRPDGLQVMVEKGVMMLHGMVVESMGAHNAHWVPFIGTIFLSSICGSFIGLTGFLRSSTADVNCTAVWALMVSFIIWFNNIKNNGIGNFLKNYINPMNIISDLAQPLSMAFRHFSNVSVGGIISAIIYAALTLLSTIVIQAVASTGWLMGSVLIIAGILLFFLWAQKKKKVFSYIVSILSFVIGVFGLLEGLNVLKDVPIFTYGIPAVLSVYFDFFSGFIQALVFTLLSMVYIGGSLPAPEEATAN
jgi:F-type H+-transporting ATPase subunit a